MATKAAVISGKTNPGAIGVKWLAMANGDVGGPPTNYPLTQVSLPGYPDRTIQFTGTFGAGGSVSLKGSNDGGNTWAILTDPLGNALTFTSAGMKQITELPEYVRPEVTAGDGTTSINAYLFCRGEQGC